jgi:hypothetical protein
VGSAADTYGLGMAPPLYYDLSWAASPISLEASCSLGLSPVSGEISAFPSVEVWMYQDTDKPMLLYYYDAKGAGVSATNIMQRIYIHGGGF